MKVQGRIPVPYVFILLVLWCSVTAHLWTGLWRKRDSYKEWPPEEVGLERSTCTVSSKFLVVCSFVERKVMAKNLNMHLVIIFYRC